MASEHGQTTDTLANDIDYAIDRAEVEMGKANERYRAAEGYHAAADDSYDRAGGKSAASVTS